MTDQSRKPKPTAANQSSPQCHCIQLAGETLANLLTVSQIADKLGEPPQRIAYIIRKFRIKAVQRIGLIRLFDERQVKAIQQGLYGIQIRRGI